MCRVAGRAPVRSTIFIAPLPINTKMETALCLKNRLPLSMRSLSVQCFVIVALLFLCLLSIGQLNGAEQDAFRGDILTFHGNQRITADMLTGNSFPVILTCKTSDPSQTPQGYSIILRSIDPVEKRLLQDAQQGQWSRFDLFRAALIAEGVRDSALIRTYESRLDALVAKVLTEARASGDTTSQTLTRSLFEAMHREILTSPYSLHSTELSKVMSTGSFNCVSATILFNCLAEKAGLDVSGLEMPRHALSRIKFSNGVVMNIETTAPTWFAMQTDQERQLATLQRIAPVQAVTKPPTAQNAVAPSEVVADAELLSQHREINSVQLVATIYYNIGVDLHAQKRFPEAMAANIKALYLDRDNKQAWTNLLASLNDWALEFASESKGREYKNAAVILDEGIKLDSTYTNFRANQGYVFYLWIQDYAKLGYFDTAREIYEKHAKKRVPDNEHLQRLMNGIDLAEKEYLARMSTLQQGR